MKGRECEEERGFDAMRFVGKWRKRRVKKSERERETEGRENRGKERQKHSQPDLTRHLSVKGIFLKKLGNDCGLLKPLCVVLPLIQRGCGL